MPNDYDRAARRMAEDRHKRSAADVKRARSALAMSLRNWARSIDGPRFHVTSDLVVSIKNDVDRLVAVYISAREHEAQDAKHLASMGKRPARR